MSKNFTSLREEMQKADQANGRATYENIPKLFIDKDGTYRIRILPSNNKETRIPFQIYKLHYYKNPNFPESDKKASWVCGDRGCPMCSEAFAAAKHEKENNVERGQRVAWRMFARSTAHYHIMDMNDSGTVKVLSAEKNEQYENGLHDEIMREIDALFAEDINAFDMDDGRILSIERRTIDEKKKFIIKFENESHVVPQAAREKLNKIRPLNRIYWRHTNEELNFVLEGKAWRKKEGSSGPSSTPSKNTSAPVRTQNSRPESKPTPAPESPRENLFADESADLPEMNDAALDDDEIARMRAEIFPEPKKA